jgi:hypothetical protein
LEFEIGGDAPVIEARWTGFVDLRSEPERASELTEARQFPALADLLKRLNAKDSPLFTSKTDVFVPENIDVDELDATSESATHVWACYIDLLMCRDQQWNSMVGAERYCKDMCARMRKVLLKRCRVDLVIRRAHVELGSNDLGITAYFTSCGRTEIDAKSRLAECLFVFAKEIVPA